MSNKLNAGGGTRTLTLLPGRDFESPTQNTEQSPDKELIDLAGPDFAIYLAKIVQKHPELARLIEAWPALPMQTKSKIKDLIEKHTMEGKAGAPTA